MLINNDLITRYSKQIPRYTSYPSAIEFNNTYSCEDWKGSLIRYANSEATPLLSLYCHIPFCRSLCYFCACNKIITKTRERVRPYLNAIKKEIRTYGNIFYGRAKIAQLHWGGGTPNYLNPEELCELFDAISSSFENFSSSPDISIELDPRTVTSGQLTTLKKLGFNRISLGVQDFNENVQKAINRVQSFDATKRLCDEARALGIKSINIDLIYGLPHQTQESFMETLELVNLIKPARIALYGYAHVTWISKTQRLFEKKPLPVPEERLKLFTNALKFLKSSGYEYIGMDHFALPKDELTLALNNGSLHRNFMGYSTHKTTALLGFGVSAISTLPDAFSQNERDLKNYVLKMENDAFASERGLKRTFEDRWRAALIEEIMCHAKVDLNSFSKTWGVSFSNAQTLLTDPIRDGLVKLGRGTLKITKTGRFFLRNIASYFDAYLSGASKQRHSQSI